jgi:fructose-bisphosphate aldolase, class II
MNKPLPGNIVYNALKNKKCIILACNPRILKGVAKSIFRAAKDLDSAIIMELARSECNQDGGYTGLTPKTFSQGLYEANKEVGHDVWILHADHIGVKKGTPEDIQSVKETISAQIDAGYTSFAIDASHLFNFNGKTVEEELAPNINATIELAKFIKQKMAGKEFGLEVEVGEIGRKDSEGMILTTPEQAVVFIKKLTEAGIRPNLLATANGSSHGNVYDENGKQIAKLTIDAELTKSIAKALRANGFDVRIAQHGITGTPLEMIRDRFPHGDVLKGNVATLFQNIVFDAIQKHQPDLYKEMFDWTIKNHPIEGKKPDEVFGKNGKNATKEFFDKIYSMSDECRQEVEEKTYEAACNHIRAFKAEGSASIVRKSLKK